MSATPAPTTPAPATPAPTTPAPTTPAPATPVPATPVPATPVPATPAPATPALATPAPATPALATPAPATRAPATRAPATRAPATAAPVAAAPVGISLTENMENYILIDIGANLTSKKFSRDLDSVLQRAKNAGVQKIMVTGTSVQGSRDALRLTRLYPSVLYCTVGVHPHDATSWTDSTRAELCTLAASPECVAIGECGLDFNRNFSPPDVQLDVFEKQVALACELRKPLFVHEREAHTELVSVLETFGKRLPPTVIHCFTGSAEHAAKYLQMGFYIGLTGYVWKDKSADGVRRMLEDQLIPLDRLLLETDSPFMYPNVRAAKVAQHVKEKLSERALQFLHRYCTFQRNEPCSLAASAEMIAAYMGHSVYDVAMKTTYNAVKLFGLSS